jgi:hypothetical protein
MAEPAQVQFPDRVRLALNFDPGRLEDDLGRLRGCEWISHFVKQNYDGDWSVIPLRAPAGATHPVMMIYSSPTAKEFVDTPLLAHTPYFRELLAAAVNWRRNPAWKAGRSSINVPSQRRHRRFLPRHAAAGRVV